VLYLLSKIYLQALIDAQETNYVPLATFQSHVSTLIAQGANAPTQKGKASVLHLAVRLPCEEKATWLLRTLGGDSQTQWQVVDAEGLTPAELAAQLNKQALRDLIVQLATTH
jgi:hypothetical protein